MRCAVIDGGVVINVIEADASTDVLNSYLLVNSETANIGDGYANGVFTQRAVDVVVIPASTGNTP